MNKEINLVKKSYKELQEMVVKLTTDKFLSQKRWDSLRDRIKYLRDLDKDYKTEMQKTRFCVYDNLLVKMNELEGNDK